MPFLMIKTNKRIDEAKALALIAKASKALAQTLGKPEKYVMVELADNAKTMFGGDSSPLAYLELKSIGLPRKMTPELSAKLCALMEQEAGIPKDRVYIEFSDAAPDMWGWSGGTF